MKEIRKPKYDSLVKRSDAGLGLFANEDIPKSRFVIEYFGKNMSQAVANKKGGKYLFEVSKSKVIDGSTRKNIARYVNHSCLPNCETRVAKGHIYIYSRKKIKKGDELGYDYGKEYFEEHIKPMGCICVKCRK